MPTLPPRFYYAFRKPIHTSPEDLHTRQRCEDIYREVGAPPTCSIALLRFVSPLLGYYYAGNLHSVWILGLAVIADWPWTAMTLDTKVVL